MKLFLTYICILTFAFKAISQEKDTKALQIADEVMKAMGGEKAWNVTHHLHWNFFGARTLTWDKWTGNVRIDFEKENTILLINVNNSLGKAFVKGEEVTQPDSLKKHMKQALGIWINDSYWLTMPFKLKDEGVHLTYLGEEKTAAGNLADVLELTFTEVGNTPENKYHIFVDKTTRLVNQWAYFPKATDEKPRFLLPWGNYKKFGKIVLSSDRGERDLTNIQVYSKLPESVYSSFEKPLWQTMK